MNDITRGTLEFGPYRLESELGRLWRDSEEIALRPKSLKVLAYLARHPGRLVTKEELREQVWGATQVSDTRLRVTVREVRAALGRGQDGQEYLETVPGRGYRFVATIRKPRSTTRGRRWTCRCEAGQSRSAAANESWSTSSTAFSKRIAANVT